MSGGSHKWFFRTMASNQLGLPYSKRIHSRMLQNVVARESQVDCLVRYEKKPSILGYHYNLTHNPRDCRWHIHDKCALCDTAQWVSNLGLKTLDRFARHELYLDRMFLIDDHKQFESLHMQPHGG